jgi:type II secretory pathway component PulF
VKKVRPCKVGMENRKQFSVRSIKHIEGENSNIFKTNQNIKKKLFAGARFSIAVQKFSVFSKKMSLFFIFGEKKLEISH